MVRTLDMTGTPRSVPAPQEYLTVKEAANIARIHVRTLYALIRHHPRSAPPFCRVRRSIRIRTSSFYSWMERRK